MINRNFENVDKMKLDQGSSDCDWEGFIFIPTESM